jgi:hypothetical protein
MARDIPGAIASSPDFHDFRWIDSVRGRWLRPLAQRDFAKLTAQLRQFLVSASPGRCKFVHHVSMILAGGW